MQESHNDAVDPVDVNISSTFACQRSRLVSAVALLWNHYCLVFTCDWAVTIVWHVVIIPPAVLWLCVRFLPTCSASQCWWTKKESFDLKNQHHSGVPTVNIARLMSFSKGKKRLFLPTTWLASSLKCVSGFVPQYVFAYSQAKFLKKFPVSLQSNFARHWGTLVFRHVSFNEGAND